VRTSTKPRRRSPKAGVLEQASERKRDRPWHAYQAEASYRLLEPGWAGVLDDEELSYIQDKLKADPALAHAWGFRPGQKTRSEAAIRRVAMSGDPNSRATNVKLARTKKAR
jgi:hypothetical protein